MSTPKIAARHDPTRHTALAYPNIALIKYWGKADDALHIPTTSSISLTLDTCPTTTSVALSDETHTDEVFYGEHVADPQFASRVSTFLQLVRDIAGDHRPAVVHTHNDIPTAAGLASSASGFAALTVAACSAYGLRLSPTELSRLARRGSGSAARSTMSGFAIWHRGQDDQTSYAEPLMWPGLDASIVVVGVDLGPKPIPSRTAMHRTMNTSPFYWPWVEQSHHDLDAMLTAGNAGDLATVGEIAERNALAMHATMLGARPPVRYFTPATVEILDYVRQLRASGTLAYSTMDAGPNVKIICSTTDSEEIAADIRARWPHHFCTTATPGPAAQLLAAGDSS